MDERTFAEALKGAKIPILVLDQKWHRLFAINGKPEEVKTLETELNELLARQGKLNTDLKEYKKVKNNLMQNVMQNMEGSESHKSNSEIARKKLEEDKRLIDEANVRIEECEDELLDIPNKIKEVNLKLMLLTMEFSYEKLRTNSNEIDEISDWIQKFRVELKRNIIRKQNREINNKEIYSYMHDIFGKDVINLFDVKYDDEEHSPLMDKEADKKENE